MTVLNLDKTFQPFGAGIQLEKNMFPSGFEVHVKIPIDWECSHIQLTTRIKSGDDLITLLMATDALRRIGVRNISLFLPYLPYARQDRVMTPGESLSVKVIADTLNAQNYSEVILFDPHSEVSMALINNAKAINNSLLVEKVLKDKENYHLICPDAGAYKKIFFVASFIGYAGHIVLCNKVRDVSNHGEIKSISVDAEDLGGKDCYIVDDICSKGGTFIGISKALKQNNAGKVYLIVSHYEGSANEHVLSQHLDGIFTTDSMNDYHSTFVKQIPICSILS